MSNNNSNSNSPKRDFLLNKDVKSVNVEDIIKGIIEINKHDDVNEVGRNDYVRQPINIIVDTFGGSIYDGFALVGVMDMSKTPIHTYAYGKTMSMGIPIFTAGHKRFAHPVATFMYHQISSGTGGRLEDMKDDMKEVERLQDLYDSWILSVTNLPKMKMTDSREKKYDWFFTAEEAIKYGVADELLISTVKRGVK